MWVEQFDPNSNALYYYNVDTKESVWEKPPEFTKGTLSEECEATLKIQSIFRGRKTRKEKEKVLKKKLSENLSLSEEIEKGKWIKQFDPSSSAHYYYHTLSGESTWDEPEGFEEGGQDERLESVLMIQCAYRARAARRLIYTMKNGVVEGNFSLKTVDGNKETEQKLDEKNKVEVVSVEKSNDDEKEEMNMEDSEMKKSGSEENVVSNENENNQVVENSKEKSGDENQNIVVDKEKEHDTGSVQEVEMSTTSVIEVTNKGYLESTSIMDEKVPQISKLEVKEKEVDVLGKKQEIEILCKKEEVEAFRKKSIVDADRLQDLITLDHSIPIQNKKIADLSTAITEIEKLLDTFQLSTEESVRFAVIDTRIQKHRRDFITISKQTKKTQDEMSSLGGREEMSQRISTVRKFCIEVLSAIRTTFINHLKIDAHRLLESWKIYQSLLELFPTVSKMVLSTETALLQSKKNKAENCLQKAMGLSGYKEGSISIHASQRTYPDWHLTIRTATGAVEIFARLMNKKIQEESLAKSAGLEKTERKRMKLEENANRKVIELQAEKVQREIQAGVYLALCQTKWKEGQALRLLDADAIEQAEVVAIKEAARNKQKNKLDAYTKNEDWKSRDELTVWSAVQEGCSLFVLEKCIQEEDGKSNVLYNRPFSLHEKNRSTGETLLHIACWWNHAVNRNLTGFIFSKHELIYLPCVALDFVLFRKGRERFSDRLRQE